MNSFSRSHHFPSRLAALLLGGAVLASARMLPVFAQAGRPTQNPSRTPSPKRPQGLPAAPPNLPKPHVTPDPNRPHLLAPGEYLPTSRLKAGMKGYGLTVFQGNTIERFEVTILGVVRKVNNGRDLIVVKLGGPKLQRVTDVIAGMSGSPVYVGGKIVGAVSMGSQFTRESIGYLTPIEDMLEAWDPGLPQVPGSEKGSTKTSARPLPEPVVVNGQRFTKVQVASKGSGERDVLTLRPLMTPVSVSGVSPSRFARVARELEQLGLKAEPGGGSGDPSLKGSALQPGGAVAMSLATGDIDITAVGTLTYRRGNRIVAFGHPFLGIGPVEAGMMTAYIHDIEPSFAASHKIWSPLSLVGTFSQDRPFSVGGRIGPLPRWIPLTVRVNDHAMRRNRTFNARLTRHPQLTSALATLAAGTAIAEVHGQPGDVTATVTTEVVADEIGTIRRTNRVFDSGAIDEAALSDLRSALSLCVGNPLYPVAVRSVKMDVTIEPGRKTAQIERIFLKQTRFEPGDTVEVGVVLKPYKRDPVTKLLKVQIPPSAPNGAVVLTVTGGSGGFGGISLPGGIVIGGRGVDLGNAVTLPQMAAKFMERDRNDSLIARLALPTTSLSVRGETLTDLPPHIETAMRIGATRSSGIRQERDEVKTAEQTEYVITGAQSLPLRVARKGSPETLMPMPSTPPPSSQPPPTTPPSGTSGQPTTPPPGNGPEDESDEPEFRTTGAAFVLPQQQTVTIPAGQPAPPVRTTITVKAPGLNDNPTTPAPTGAGEARPVGRQPGIWRQAGLADFRTGAMDGVTVSSQGEVRLAPKLTRVAESEEPYFWTVVPDGAGGVYAGSGDAGRIYRLAADGKKTVFAETGEFEIHALARASDGTLYAGTSPHGRVLKIGPDGKAVTLLQTREKYVLALTLDPKGEHLYAATGGPKGRIYDIPVGVKGEAATLYQSDESNITALAMTAEGNLYAGTFPSGRVLHIAGPGLKKPSVLYDAVEPAISGLAAGPDGVVYAVTAPRGTLYRLAPGQAPRVVYDRAPALVLSGVLLARDGTLYTASGASVIALSPERGGNGDTVRFYDAPSDIQILSLCQDEGGRVWAATGNVAGVYALGEAKAPQGEYVSTVLDARAASTWGSIRWSADVPSGGGVRIQTRSGDTLEPDATWSDWSVPYSDPNGERIASPPARYLQYRVTLTGSSSGGIGPVLRSVEAFYLPPNQAPQIAALPSPRPGEVWRGVKPLRWNAADPDRDMLTFDVTVSRDGGKTWQPAPTQGSARSSAPMPKPVAAPPRNDGATPTEGESQMLRDLRAELDKRPEMSAEMRARILADAATQMRPSTSATVPAPGGESSPAHVRESSVMLDTTRLADGDYLLRIVASDRAANPTGALTTERIVGPVRIVNRAPVVVVVDKATTVRQDKSISIDGVAMQTQTAIRAVQYRVDGGEWVAAVAKDGIFDAPLESFTLTTGPLSSGSHTIEVQALDEAGNTATQKKTVPVP
jgi:hypothetical protein